MSVAIIWSKALASNESTGESATLWATLVMLAPTTENLHKPDIRYDYTLLTLKELCAEIRAVYFFDECT